MGKIGLDFAHSGICSILVTLEWCLTFYFTLFSFGELLDPTHFVCYNGCSGIRGILVTFEWCLLCKLSSTLLYSRLVDCWPQLTLCVIKAAQV
jgi:hypothetical protein